MASLMEEIRTAERSAEKVRQDALQTIKEKAGAFKAASEAELQELVRNEREESAKAVDAAEKEGEEMTRKILGDLAEAAEKECERADAHMDKACDHILKKVFELA